MTDYEVDAEFRKCREPVIGYVCQWIEADIPEYTIISRIHDAYREDSLMMRPGCDRKLSFANELCLAARMIAKGEEHTVKARELLKEAFSGSQRHIELFIPSGMKREAILRDLREALEILTSKEFDDLREEILENPSDLPEKFAQRIWNSLK